MRPARGGGESDRKERNSDALKKRLEGRAEMEAVAAARAVLRRAWA